MYIYIYYIHVYVYICIYICIYIYIHIHTVYIYIYTYTCIYTHMYTCIHVYGIYIYTLCIYSSYYVQYLSMDWSSHPPINIPLISYRYIILWNIPYRQTEIPKYTDTLKIEALKQKFDAAHEPECSHVCYWYRCRNTWICRHPEHFSAIVYVNSLVHIFHITSLQCGVESVGCGVWSVKCKLWSVKCGVGCRVCKVKCRVWSVECRV